MKSLTTAVFFLLCIFSQVGNASNITTCLPKTTFDKYQLMGSCIIGQVEFSDFLFSAPSGTMRSAADTSIQPVVNDQGLYSQINLGAVGPADGSSITLSFLETAIAGNVINVLGFEVNENASHGGLASVTEDYCIGHIILGCPAGFGGEIALSSSSLTFSNLVDLPGVTSVYVSYTTTVLSGAFGSAAVIQFENSTTTSPVPEPGVLPMAACLSLILLVVRGKFLRRLNSLVRAG